ncbi:MAG: hypothetical protein K6E91_04080 [Butyrivibrio sp.]|nr:hypothetical protein [Butyrivibrio sp.]
MNNTSSFAGKGSPKIIDAVNYNGKYVNVDSLKTRFISVAVALMAIASFIVLLLF